MEDTFVLEIVTPHGAVCSEEVTEVTAPGTEGEFGVLAGHAHFLTTLKPGEVAYKKGNETGRIVVGRGFAEVGPKQTTLLVDEAFTGGDIDLEGVRAEIERLSAKLKEMDEEDPGRAEVLEALMLEEAKAAFAEKGEG